MTKLREMKIGIRYRVLTNGTTLKIGDSICKCPDNVITVQSVLGWLDQDSWWNLRNKVAVDINYYEAKRMSLIKEVKELDLLIGEAKTQKIFDNAKDEIQSWPKWKQDACKQAMGESE